MSVQQRLTPRMSAEIGYYRRWLHNFTVVDNRSLQPADFEPFAVTAPLDPRLPGGGGHTVSGLYNVVPDKFGLVDDFVTYAENYGEQTRYWHGVDVTVNARLENGLTIQGGTSTGQTVTDNCEIRAALPEIDPLDPYCHVATGFQTQGKALIAYSIPRVDVTVSATYRDQPGPQLAANWVVPNAVIVPSLGRDLAGGAANVTVNLIEPGTLYGDRIRLTEVRIAKIFRVADTRTQVAVDVHNLFNSSTSQTYNQTFGPRWLTPTLVLPARFVRISAQLDF